MNEAELYYHRFYPGASPDHQVLLPVLLVLLWYFCKCCYCKDIVENIVDTTPGRAGLVWLAFSQTQAKKLSGIVKHATHLDGIMNQPYLSARGGRVFHRHTTLSTTYKSERGILGAPGVPHCLLLHAQQQKGKKNTLQTTVWQINR